MVVSEGNIRYQGNDDEIHIREKIRDYPACKTLQECESTVDGIFLSCSVLIKLSLLSNPKNHFVPILAVAFLKKPRGERVRIAYPLYLYA